MLPIDPPIAIICKCLPFNLLTNGVFAILYAAALGLYCLPSSPVAGAKTRSGAGRKPSKAFADTLLAVFGRCSKGVTVAVDPAERLFAESILRRSSI